MKNIFVMDGRKNSECPFKDEDFDTTTDWYYSDHGHMRYNIDFEKLELPENKSKREWFENLLKDIQKEEYTFWIAGTMDCWWDTIKCINSEKLCDGKIQIRKCNKGGSIKKCMEYFNKKGIVIDEIWK